MLRRELAIGLGWWHDEIGVVGINTLDKGAGFGIAGYDRAGIECRPSLIETEIRFSLIAILTMTEETILREERTNVAIEIQRLLRQRAIAEQE